MFDLYKFLDWLYEVNKDTPHQSRYHHESFYQHTIAVAYNATLMHPSRRLFIAAVLHDIGKPETVMIRDGKGATFYNHETHLDLIKEFLSEDDEDYEGVCNLIRYHMLPYTMKGPDPWKTNAEQTFTELIRTYGTDFIMELLILHNCDMKGSFANKADVPDNNTLLMMLNAIRYPIISST